MERTRENGAAWTAERTRTLVLTGLFAALSCAATMAVQVPSPTGGYMTLGDAVVLLGACLLGPVGGAAAGGIGPALADLLSGYSLYALATLVIKGFMGLLAALLYRRFGRSAGGLLLCAAAAEIPMVLGYWVFDGALIWAGGGGSLALCLAGSAAGIPSNLVQAAFGTAASTALLLSLRKSRALRERFPGLRGR